jgi:uncharacterized membrane protein YozB (DUF420 family)
MATSPALIARLRDRKFYLAMALFAAVVVFAGFARTFFLNPFFARLSLPRLYVFHGIVFSSWIVLLVTQAALISSRKLRVHRLLGYAAIALVLLMIVVGLTMAVRSVQRGFSPPGAPPPHSFMVIPVGDITVFTVLTGLAFWYRNRSETHKRLMLVGTLAILPPATARILLLFTTSAVLPLAYGSAFAVMLGCMLYDYRNHRRVHPAYVWSVLFFAVSVPLRMYIGGTAAWLSFAHWITGT